MCDQIESLELLSQSGGGGDDSVSHANRILSPASSESAQYVNAGIVSLVAAVVKL